MIGALLCEVEGVLANTEPLRRAALEHALAEDGIALAESSDGPNDDRASTRDRVWHALRGRDAARDETAITLIAHRADRHFASLINTGISLAPGARELLEFAAGRCRLAIVTAMERAPVEYVISHADLESVFEVIIASDDMAADKPSPDGYRKALTRMSRRRPLDVRSAVALEGSATGARAARAAGLRCVVVASARSGRATGADAVLSSLAGQTPDTIEAALTLEAVG